MVRADEPQTRRTQCYIQTLMEIDSILRGWAGAFQHSRSTQALASIDAEIDVQLAAFDHWFGALVEGRPTASYRRAIGIRLLSDSEPTPLPRLGPRPPVRH